MESVVGKYPVFVMSVCTKLSNDALVMVYVVTRCLSFVTSTFRNYVAVLCGFGSVCFHPYK